jgi:ABC-type sulfate/molybdate transport systems ATPase subunit
MRGATFGDGCDTVGPVSVDVNAGERVTLVCSSAREAAITAKLGAGLVKATAGSVSIGEFDPRVQPVHCKRIAAFVPHAALALPEMEFERYIAYRAALWNVDRRRATAHAKLILERLQGVHEAFAFPLAGALITPATLVVLERPQPAYAEQIVAAVGSRSMFSTHLERAAAELFANVAVQA